MVEWDRRVAREAEHQARIEAAFDWADEHDRLGDVALALEWLDKASALSGGLTPAYREKRLRLSREVARPREAPQCRGDEPGQVAGQWAVKESNLQP
jgi:hypothetical protein